MVSLYSPCLDENAVAALISGSLPSERLARVKAHVASCGDCQRIVAAAASDLESKDTFPSGDFSARPESRSSEEYAPGTVIAGRYEVQHTLGRGGMGTVVAALHLGLRQRVAIKFLDHSDADARARFLREGHILGQLRSPHVVRVYDSGALNGVTPFIVMEYLEGDDVAARLKRGPLAVDTVVAYARQVCMALEAAHAAGIVHRDLKPSNLFLAVQPDGSEVLKVLDFGVSKSSAAHEHSTLTTTGAVVGTPMYMSPEQLRGSHDVDQATDVWSLGAIMYELLTGRAPFSAGTISGLILAIATQPAVSPKLLCPEVSSELEAVIMRCLEKEVAQRFSSAAQLRAALESCVSERAPVPSAGSSRGWLGVALVLLLSLAALGLWATRRSEPVAAPTVQAQTAADAHESEAAKASEPPSAAAEPAPAASDAVTPPPKPVPPPSKRPQRDSLDVGDIIAP